MSLYIEYIGDSVYAKYDGDGVWLFTEDHCEPTNQVYLEHEVFDRLVKFRARCKEAQHDLDA